MTSSFWLNDPTILLKHDKLSELWPKPEMTVEEKINSFERGQKDI